MTDPLQNSILRISDEKTLQLISLYEEEPCLWDTTCAEYRSRDYKGRDKRANAAARIARKLRIKNFEAKHVMIKFKNLRNSYCQELKKIAASVYAGLGENAYTPRVCWFQKMDSFLRPHVQPTRGLTTSFLKQTEEPNKEEEEAGLTVAPPKLSTTTLPREPVAQSSEPIAEPLEESEVKTEIEIEEDEWMQRSHAEEDIGDMVELTIRPSPSVSSDEDQPLAKKPKRKRQSGSDQFEPAKQPEGAVQVGARVLQDIAAQLEVLSGRRDDALDAFGRYVASLLRGMPPARAAALQPRVVALLTTTDDDHAVTQSDQNL